MKKSPNCGGTGPQNGLRAAQTEQPSGLAYPRVYTKTSVKQSHTKAQNITAGVKKGRVEGRAASVSTRLGGRKQESDIVPKHTGPL